MSKTGAAAKLVKFAISLLPFYAFCVHGEFGSSLSRSPVQGSLTETVKAAWKRKKPSDIEKRKSIST